MADFLGNFLSALKQNIPYLKDRDVNSEIMLGILMHLFLVVLLYRFIWFVSNEVYVISVKCSLYSTVV